VLSHRILYGPKAPRHFVPHRMNQILTKYMTGNNSGALLLTTFALTRGRGNDPFIARGALCAFRLIVIPEGRKPYPGS